MNLPDTLRLNEFGFYEIKHKPTPEELREYYAQRYYQENLTTYQASYPPEELEHIEGKLKLRHWVLADLRNQGAGATDATATGATDLAQLPTGSFLDIGCGEGWALDYFQRQGWDVLGLDFSSFSLEKFHPALRERLRTGDLYEELEKFVAAGQQFDVLWLDNVLEHVLEPAELLRLCRTLVKPNGVLMVDVPNDFSALQQHLLDGGHIDRPFWVVLPDHLSYFNQTGLRNLAQDTGWHVAKVIGDQPIDINLLNPATNYVMDRAAGKAAHRARLEQDNLLLRTAPLPAVAAYYEAMAGVGLGRSIVAFLQPA
ncbi:class I SAM-dependent methyltransferase [Hymenobacter sp. BT770]|uniref:class I SAM-dependent methyltransferase n=1 Tax=Hymenobacter sp. BT770 TaxID=2886942 RepID=UPI001D113957|nr:class I SAM-dependent methyltransferase [Hymenobacter sp. BT770]MCC3152195.1 class I SAM-dependent methyltransferase [Hymenobacter sp. BT770]MDO3414009.1 class I SAM-dependent methyltransferase [Hymenobacter sp. BT770]